mmetsp:Transcript_4217/g.7389  ORF Transcript_4217/g.7389 Transcript_4217/m.7389 type:complete len:90 (-) Transcript_4217:47-316(-)
MCQLERFAMRLTVFYFLGLYTLQSAAQKLMNFSSQKALEDYMAMKENWEVNGSKITFKGEPVKDLADQIPSHSLIQSSLNYAHELERIV